MFAYRVEKRHVRALTVLLFAEACGFNPTPPERVRDPAQVDPMPASPPSSTGPGMTADPAGAQNPPPAPGQPGTGAPDANHPPIAVAARVAGMMNQVIDIALMGSDPDGDMITFHASNPHHGALVRPSGTNHVFYAPIPDYFGSDSFDFTVNDGRVDSPSATITISLADNRSCASLLATGGATQGSGLYAIYPNGILTSKPTEVYCDMTVDSGGWTLVGRSAEPPTMGFDPMGPTGPGHGGPMAPMPMTQVPFGWSVDVGSPKDDGQPYALDTNDAAIPFHEILVATYDDNKNITAAFRLTLDTQHFYSDCYQQLCPTTVTPVLGTCGTSPTALSQAGVTHAGYSFMFAMADESAYGLLADHYVMPDDCAGGGGLNGRPGMIFVR
jgi:hypothetical protein